MNAGRVREQPHRATPPRKSRAAGTPGVLAPNCTCHGRRLRARRWGPQRGSRVGVPWGGPIRGHPLRRRCILRVHFASWSGVGTDLTPRSRVAFSPTFAALKGRGGARTFQASVHPLRAMAITLDSAHVVAVLVPFALTDQAP